MSLPTQQTCKCTLEPKIKFKNKNKNTVTMPMIGEDARNLDQSYISGRQVNRYSHSVKESASFLKN